MHNRYGAPKKNGQLYFAYNFNQFKRVVVILASKMIKLILEQIQNWYKTDNYCPITKYCWLVFFRARCIITNFASAK